jgi:N-acylglucosamine-6-phosphate 2-epimerase
MSGRRIYFPIVKKLENSIIVSSQASINEPFYPDEAMKAMIQSVINGGAQGLRLAGPSHIHLAKMLTDLPVIGITKPDIIPENYKEIVYITPAFQDAEAIYKAGADIIAIDATSRKRPAENLEVLIQRIHSELNCPVMADISTIDEGLNACELGADILSTTLAGYTAYSKATNGPDFELLDRLIKYTDRPVILEGRIETPDHVKIAFEKGAFAVVIGSAITRPQLITHKFVNIIK